MLDLIDLLSENTMHIFKAEELAKVIPNEGRLSETAPKEFSHLSFEPCTLYKKKSMEAVPAFIVKKGSGPHRWARAYTKMAIMSKGSPVIYTNGQWAHNSYCKTLCGNLLRRFLNVHRSTMICVRNVKSNNPDRVVHDIFKVVEVVCDNN